MIHVVEDEALILSTFSRYLTGFNFEFMLHAHWNTCEPMPGDIVIHDLGGVGDKKEVTGVRYISCSGMCDCLIDLPKPFSKTKLLEVLQKAMS